MGLEKLEQAYIKHQIRLERHNLHILHHVIYMKKWRDKMRKNPYWVRKERKRQRESYRRNKCIAQINNPQK